MLESVRLVCDCQDKADGKPRHVCVVTGEGRTGEDTRLPPKPWTKHATPMEHAGQHPGARTPDRPTLTHDLLSTQRFGAVRPNQGTDQDVLQDLMESHPNRLLAFIDVLVAKAGDDPRHALVGAPQPDEVDVGATDSD